MFASLELYILAFAHAVPLPLFAFAASAIDELFPPVPSPAVMLIAGTLARMQELAPWHLAALIVLGACGKTLGAYVVYRIADGAEDVILGRFSRIFGITHAEVERFGARLTGTTRDYTLLTTLRALPFLPSVIVSVGGGLLKLPLRLFLTTTFVGTLIRDTIYFSVGYAGVEVLRRFVHASSRLEEVLFAAILCAVILGGAWYVHRRRAAKRDDEESL